MLIKTNSPAYSLIKGTSLSFWLKNISETCLSLIIAIAVTTLQPYTESNERSSAWKWLFWLKIFVSGLYLFDMVKKKQKVRFHVFKPDL